MLNLIVPVMKTKIIILLFLLLPIIIFSQTPKSPAEVVELIKKNVTCDWATQTVDNIKIGDPSIQLKGIATCMFADMATLKKAVELGCNFIVTHEPVFYNHYDNTDAYANDPVFWEKRDFIEKNNLVVFRFHDHIHMTEPDGISAGMIKKLGLKDYAVNGSLTFFQLPEQSVKKYAKSLKKTFNLSTIRVVGNSEMKFTKLAFMAGAPGGQSHIKMLKNPDVEVVLAGEATEWETYLYTNDATELGKNKAVIFLGHIKSEEAGMEYCAKWLKTFITDVPVHFIEDKPNFVTF